MAIVLERPRRLAYSIDWAIPESPFRRGEEGSRIAVQEEIAEQIRRSEVSRTLEKMGLSPEEAEAIDRMSCSLVERILHDLVSEVIAPNLEEQRAKGSLVGLGRG